MEGNAATAGCPSHRKQHDTKEKATSHQGWLQMKIKRSWKPVKPAGVSAQPPELCPWGGWKACGQGIWICNIVWLIDEGQQLWHPHHSTSNVALTHSLKKVTFRNLIKQLQCHGANSTFESCWPAGWTIWENKLDPSLPGRWPTAAGWGRFPGIYPWKSPEQMVPFRKPSITALKSRISRCSGGELCPKGEKADPESSLNRPIWLKGRRFRNGSKELMQ